MIPVLPPSPFRPSPAPARRRPWLAPFMVLMPLLIGCYLPVRFDAEIDISRAGYYTMVFDGYIADVPLYDDLRQRKINITDEKKRSETIITDFKRDRGTKEAAYLRQGVFKIAWKDEGDILRAKMVTFIRRNAAMLSLSYVETSGEIKINGASISKENIKRLTDMGLGMDGELRVTTDAKVISHNATRVADNKTKGPRFKTYTWKIQGFGRSPSLVIALR